ncbi:MAG: SCP2 sterol-binding domain-containing protein [Gammaproteobacteria bacterium]|nr:SCP2 sterol-binding domain-containing protein [Gammaproteobacteria bacterium]
MIQQVPLRVLEAAMNTALSLDELAVEKLAQFEGKTIRVFVAPLHLTFFMRFLSKKICLLPTYDGISDADIHSSPMGLIRLSLLPASKARSLFHDGVRIEGDVELAQRVKAVIDELDIDWEGHLARFTGDMVAHHVGSCVRSMKHMLGQAQSALTFQLSSYLREESGLSPSIEAVHDFCDEVDELKLDVERIEAKIKKGRRTDV